jgi:hypothetical protein
MATFLFVIDPNPHQYWDIKFKLNKKPLQNPFSLQLASNNGNFAYNYIVTSSKARQIQNHKLKVVSIFLDLITYWVGY